MKKQLILLSFLFTISLNAQNDMEYPGDPVRLQIKHYDYFNFKGDEPNEKRWSFELSIKQIGPEEFEACYSRELVSCLYNLGLFRENKVAIGNANLCFKYQLLDDNEILITDKSAVITELKNIITSGIPGLKKKTAKSLLEEIDYLLEDEAFLNEELCREIALIHEYDFYEIPIGISGFIPNDNEEEEIDMSKLDIDEQKFLNQLNWDSFKQIEVYKTESLNESLFVFDFLKGIDVLTAKESADFSTITQKFFQGNFEIDNFKNVTLARDLRHFHKSNTRLSYLLKERITTSPTMLKKTKLEISEQP